MTAEENLSNKWRNLKNVCTCVHLWSLLGAVVWTQEGITLKLSFRWGVMSRSLWPHRWCCSFQPHRWGHGVFPHKWVIFTVRKQNDKKNRLMSWSTKLRVKNGAIDQRPQQFNGGMCRLPSRMVTRGRRGNNKQTFAGFWLLSFDIFSVAKWKQNFTAKQTTFGLVSFRKCFLHPDAFLVAGQPAGPLLVDRDTVHSFPHYPPCFKSIVNYLQKCSFLLRLEKWTARGRLKFAWQRDSVLCRVKTVLPPLLLIGPSVSPLEAGIPFCTTQALHFSPPLFSFLLLMGHKCRHTNIHAQFLWHSLATKPMFNKRLHLWWGEGQANSEICPHVLNLGEELALTH